MSDCIQPIEADEVLEKYGKEAADKLDQSEATGGGLELCLADGSILLVFAALLDWDDGAEADLVMIEVRNDD